MMKNDDTQFPYSDAPAPAAEALTLPALAVGSTAASAKQPILSDFDLRQMDDEWLGQLENAQLLEVAKRLLNTAKVAKDRLNQTPNNSSRPPSSMPPWHDSKGETTPPTAGKTTATSDTTPMPDPVPVPVSIAGYASKVAKKSSGRKAGKQPGTKGFGRKQKLVVTEEEHHYPDTCAVCGQPLFRHAAQAYTGWQSIDIATLPAHMTGLGLTVTHHLLFEARCGCGHVTRADHYVAAPDELWDKVALGQWRLVGPKLAGVIVFLALRMRLSRARIQEFLAELLNLELSTGTIDETIREAGRAMAPLEQELATEIEQAVMLHVDETPWKEAGQVLWLWVFVAKYTKLFYIGHRTMEILANALPDTFAGILVSDGYSAYRHFKDRLRCWAHLLRKLQGLIESTDAKVAKIGKSMLDIFCLLMNAIYVARDNPQPGQQGLASQYAPQIAQLKNLCLAHRDHSYDKLRSLAREFLLDWDVIMRQVDEPHLPLTNNAAEQALRD